MAVTVALILVSVLQGAISLYFATLLYPLPRWLGRSLETVAGACGIDGGACKRVVQTPYARLFGGAPNVLIGIAWAVWIIVASAIDLRTGAFPLWWPSVLVSWASLVVAVYLTWALFVRLRDPCPL